MTTTKTGSSYTVGESSFFALAAFVLVMAQFFFAVSLLLAVLAITRCSSLYYQARPTINIVVDILRLSEVGDYIYDYAKIMDIPNADLVVIEDSYFGCPEEDPSPATGSVKNITLPPKDSYFVVMLPYLGGNSPCSEFGKAVTARRVWGAAGVIYYYTPEDPQKGKLRRRPADIPAIENLSVTKVELSSFKINALLSEVDKGLQPRVSVKAHYHPFQTTQTFYFIVFAFCILMLLSCLWFVMSYVKRCHYSLQRRRRRVRREQQYGSGRVSPLPDPMPSLFTSSGRRKGLGRMLQKKL